MSELTQEQIEDIELNGSEAFTGLPQDVNAEESVESSTQQESEKGPIPYDRFAEVNTERNQLREQVNQLMSQMQMLSQNIQQQNHPEPEASSQPQVETIQDLVEYVKKSVQTDIQPVKETLRLEKIARGVESYFATNQEAAQLRNAMDAYTATMPEYRKAMILDSIERGDRSVMDEIFYTVKAKNFSNTQKSARISARESAESIGLNSQGRSIPRTAPTSNDLVKKGVETGDFSDYFKNFVTQNLGIK